MLAALKAVADVERRCLPPEHEWFWCELELLAAQAGLVEPDADVCRALADRIEAVAASAHRGLGVYLVTLWAGERMQRRTAAELEDAIDRALADEDPFALIAAARAAFAALQDRLRPSSSLELLT